MLYSSDISNEHSLLRDILQTRGMDSLPKNYPLWKFKLSDEEYDGLKRTIQSNVVYLYKFGIEAALCYAEWWRRDYRGYYPNKEQVAIDVGVPEYHKELFDAAKGALEQNGYTFLHSLKGKESFRTLLNQGGLPITYIKNNDSNMGSFTRFLGGLVRELSIINYDWNNDANSIIQQFNCISYLSKGFRNENIYAVAMQIAHAIIMDDTELLPYDDTDASLSELTKSLLREYKSVKSEKRTRPLSLSWKLRTTQEGIGYLLVNMDIVKDISSDSIPGLDTLTCYTFDIFVAGMLVGKYSRKSFVYDDDGNAISAIYTRISTGMAKDILWKGEPVVEVKVRCDNDERLFLTVAGCYPPNFDHPQVFQMMDDNLYSKSETANAENNIVVFSSEWESSDANKLTICDYELNYVEFTSSVELSNQETLESVKITNQFTPYSAEFSGNYIPWVEKSNYKILSKVPSVHVYDKDKNRINNCKVTYRGHHDKGSNSWRTLRTSCALPIGLVDIRVEFPDGNYIVETFYSIRDMTFGSANEDIYSTEINFSCSSPLKARIESLENIEITNLSNTSWKISRNRNSMHCPSVCYFRINNADNPYLRVAIAIPFEGTIITDTEGNIVPRGKVISFANLSHFRITNHGGRKRKVDVSYYAKSEDFSSRKHLKANIINGLVPLSDYSDLILRTFNLYGANTFDRTSSVMLRVPGQEVFIRKFVLETTIDNGTLVVVDNTEDDAQDFLYEGELYAFPVDESLGIDDFYPISLIREEKNNNRFCLPDTFTHNEFVVFSGPEVRRRIIPKYFNRDGGDYTPEERTARSHKLNKIWYEYLSVENFMSGKHWQLVCKAFDICSNQELPFTTYNGLKVIARSPELLAKFIVAMCVHDHQETLIQDIERFEQEMVVALHWIPRVMWEKSFNALWDYMPDKIMKFKATKQNEIIALLDNLFNTSLSTVVARDFKKYILNGKLKKAEPILYTDINRYKMRTLGLSDTNEDLPIIEFSLGKNYYPYQRMLPSHRVMIEAPMCAAENTCDLKGCINLFAPSGKEHARIINFYRKYYKETYSEIFLRTVKLINQN